MKKFLISFLSLLAMGGTSAPAAESEPAKYPGLREVRLVTDVEAIRPGDEFTVGLLFRHEEGYHTYWKSPGIVGVHAVIDWKDLPAGFEAGAVQWPAPQTTKMASLTAWGYETDTCLLVPFQAPKNIDGQTEITLRARAGWMCCATSCHPGWHDFELTIPVSQEKSKPVAVDEEWRKWFEDSRARFPRPAPEGWNFTARELEKDSIQLVVHAPVSSRVNWLNVYFFSDDNQVDSDEPQTVSELSGMNGCVITFSRPDFAPENPPALSGVLYRPEGWPGIDSPWMIASAPWKEYQVRHVENGVEKTSE